MKDKHHYRRFSFPSMPKFLLVPFQKSKPDIGGLFEGDMRLTNRQQRLIDEAIEEMKSSTGIQPRKAAADLNVRWEGGIVPYVFDDSSGRSLKMKSDRGICFIVS